MRTVSARRVRETILDLSLHSGQCHISSALSCVEILITTLALLARHAPLRAAAARCVLSKGHAAAALYAVLHRAGLLTRRQLAGYCRNGSLLYGHPDVRVPGVAATTGSLGHGLGLAAGMAYAARLQRDRAPFVAVLSDGECNEGSTWEAAAIIAAQRLPVIAIIDANGLQATARWSDLSPGSDLPALWRAHGWQAQLVDGHSVPALTAALRRRPGKKPLAIIARTVKGRGVPFMENDIEWHYRRLDRALWSAARRELRDHA